MNQEMYVNDLNTMEEKWNSEFILLLIRLSCFYECDIIKDNNTQMNAMPDMSHISKSSFSDNRTKKDHTILKPS